MIDDRVRAALKNDIAANLLAGGPRRWKEIQRRHPQVSSATFFRVVDQVKRSQAEAADGLSAEPEAINGEIVAGISCQPAKWAGDSAGLQTPVPADRLISEIASLFDDANLLRAYALDSRGNIKFPTAFVESAKLRDRAIRVAADWLTGVYGAAAWADYMDAIVEAVAATDPDTVKRLTLALYEIQTRNLTPVPKIPPRISSDGHDEAIPVP